MAGLIDRITNILMPEEEIEEIKEEREPKAPAVAERPVLKVHTNHIPELKVKVYIPEAYAQVNVIADALRSKAAAVVNYEKLDLDEQKRICDFLNGVTYILDGSVQRISDNMVLYTAANVEISKELCSYSVPPYVKHTAQA